MKRILTICVFVIALLIVSLIWLRNETPRPTNVGVQQERSPRREGQLLPPGSAELLKAPKMAPIPSLVLRKVEYAPDYAAIARSHESLPFEFRGGGTTGRVVDRDGNVIMDSGKDIGIFGVSVAPDKKHVLVKGGNAMNFVIGSSTRSKTQLPIAPPGANMFVFESWYWINDHELVGESALKKVDKFELNVSNENNIAQSKLYVYDIINQKLTEVALPVEFDAKVFGIVEASPDGYIQLHFTNDGPQEKNPDELRWFKIGPQ